MLRIESSEESASRGEDMADYGSSEYEGSYDGDSGAYSGTSVREVEGGRGKGIVISEGSSAAKGQEGTPEKGSKGDKKRRLQSCSVDGSPSLATARRIGRIQFPRGVEWRIPLPSERPWSPPEGFMCLHESYFGWAHMFFPLPRALIEFCARKQVAISQLSAVAMIDFLGLIVFGAECDVVVDASFLEKKMRLISNWKSPGTFQTQAGVVRGKPGRINDWQLNYFFVKINEESVGGAGSMIVKEWNRELGKSFYSFY